MTKKQTTEKEDRKPSHYAWVVRDAKGKEGKAFWTKIGAYFPHEDGDGGTLLLDALPINGRIVLRTPKADEQPEAAE